MPYYRQRYEPTRPYIVPGHSFAILTRYPRGMTPIRPARQLYGWKWECECGEERRTNERQGPAKESWRDHRDTMKEAS